MKHIAALAAAAALSALAPAAFAQDALTTDHVAALDADKSGAVGRAEYEKFMEVTFVTLDVNKDGNLEWSEAQEIIPLAAFKSADADANNALSRAEFDAQVMKDFMAADRDGDGSLN
jgi:hypothetical protein